MDSEAKCKETSVRYIMQPFTLDSEANSIEKETGVPCITQLFALDSEAICEETGVR